MDTSKLKKFAQFARRALITQVSAKLESVIAENSAARREHSDAMRKLEAAIAKDGKDQVVERVAYTWFNRFSALRFMDLNELNQVRVVSPVSGQFQPEILAEAKAGHMDEGRVPDRVREQVRSLLDGSTPSSDAQTEAYRLLIVAVCNDLHKTMPYLFERIDDYTELLLPEDLLSNSSILAYVREAMTPDVCEDVEVIGWLYQFYISEKKDEVFAGLKKNKKITAENIPAATQLFTPHWIVRYLVENSLGRLWLLNRPNSQLAAQMDYYIAPEDAESDYLRISRPEDIRICDPACGSGHMLTYAFDLLYAIYEEEGYEATEIPGLILTHNLYGLEIDDRAGALAAFALAMKAAIKLGRRRFLRQAAQPNICVLQDVRFTPSEMQDVAAVVGGDLFTADFRATMGQFEQAKNFGSLIVPKLRDPAEVARVVRLKDFGGDLLLREVQERVLKVLEMAEALSTKYHVVVANPPYMGYGGMNPLLVDFLKENFQDYKSDLFSSFISRVTNLSQKFGLFGIMCPNVWMYISAHQLLRDDMLSKATILNLVELPLSAFKGATVQICAFCGLNAPRENFSGDFIQLTGFKGGDDEMSQLTRQAVADRAASWRFKASAALFKKIPNHPITYTASETVASAFNAGLFGENFICDGYLKTGNNERFIRYAWEVAADGRSIEGPWRDHLKGGDYRKWSGNREFVVRWTPSAIRHYKSDKIARILDEKYWNLEGISWSAITSGRPSFRILKASDIANNASLCIFPKYNASNLTSLAFLNSKLGEFFLKFRSQTLNVLSGDVMSLPVNQVSDACVEEISSACIKLSDADWAAYETSWDFTTLPLLSPKHHTGALDGSYAALRAHWQSMTDEMQSLEEENNRIFIDAYGLQDELTPEVPLEEITLTCNSAYRYGGKASKAELEARLLGDTIAEFLHYAVGCMFGRYSLDAPGLVLANQGEGLADYLARIPEPTFAPDADNVIPVLDGDWFADDIAGRFRKFLRVTFGEAKFQENLAFIESALGKDIRKWFTRDFYDYHVRRYKKRPIYWMFASPKGSFQALIYMHRYRPDTVSVVLNDYLREYRNKLEAHRKAQEAQSINPEATPAQRTKALKEVGEATKVIEELDGYERDVLYPLATQKVEIDLDDGVKSNYPKFGAALKPIKGLSDAGD